jgi:type IV secretion system protein VirD4
VDVKGELATICAPILRAAGFKAYVIDPHKITGQTSETFDPVRHLIPGSQEAIEESKAIPEDIIPQDPNENQPHWPQAAKANLAAAIAFVVEFGGQHRDLDTAIGTILNREYRRQALSVMRASDKQGGMVARLADEVGHATADELASIMSTLGTRLGAFSTPAVVAGMASSSFRPLVLKEEKAAVFFVIPPTHLKTERGLLRMWIGSTIRALLKDGLGGRTVHGIIDEAAAVGPLEAIDQALAVGRGYGINVHLSFQSLAQMETVYPNGQAKAVLAQTAQVYLQVQDVVTAEHVSRSLGPQTVEVESGGVSNGTSVSRPHVSRGQNEGSSTVSHSANDNWGLQSRPLLHPNEVLMLPRGVAITICPGCPPILTTLVPYFENPNLCAPKPDVTPKALVVGLALLSVAVVAAALVR